MILVDTGGLFTALNDTEPDHERTLRFVLEATEPLLLSPFVLAELDYLLATRAGVSAELALLDDVARGAYTLVEFPASELPAARDIVAKYHDLEIGLADASIVVLAARFGTDRVLTNDDRHFRALRTLDGGAFQLLPADAA
jgi:predicted nucleic acid-binding protein